MDIQADVQKDMRCRHAIFRPSYGSTETPRQPDALHRVEKSPESSAARRYTDREILSHRRFSEGSTQENVLHSDREAYPHLARPAIRPPT